MPTRWRGEWILALETSIATPQWDRAKSRDRNLSSNNKMTVDDEHGHEKEGFSTRDRQAPEVI